MSDAARLDTTYKMHVSGCAYYTTVCEVGWRFQLFDFSSLKGRYMRARKGVRSICGEFGRGWDEEKRLLVVRISNLRFLEMLGNNYS